MKLITKFLLIYLFVSTIVLGIGGVISYYIIKDEIDQELKWEFLDRIDRVTYLLEQGKTFEGLEGVNQDENLVIRSLPYNLENNVEVTDTLIWDSRLEQEEKNVKVSAYRTIQDTTYYISTYGNMIESNDVREAVITILLWILGLQVAGAIGIGYFVSGPLFKPFRNTLKRIQGFQLNESEFLKAEKTNVQEFKDLNQFVEEMTKKAVSDYKNLKEFAENASHELQTPLAIAKGKLELLTETPLNEEQYRYVESLEKTIKKLSRLSESLALLTKIENHEFIDGEVVNLSNLITEGIEAFKEFAELHNLTINTEIENGVSINMHPVLAEILWSNLFQNAIRHNIKDGSIRVILTPEKLKVSNTGNNLKVKPEQLFERFKKADPSSNSIGLGLSIIKRIADQNDMDITYVNENSWHHLEISLKTVKTG
ncbi:HAMP domain-containing sensor histidine kinase [Gracilimonas sp.]|uniref:sensor histidine kinase n=1 Tax=Gracilimonas sp. TaxID=1974203 RepID=UPI0032ECAD3A